jgi:hypothetical protein
MRGWKVMGRSVRKSISFFGSVRKYDVKVEHQRGM